MAVSVLVIINNCDSNLLNLAKTCFILKASPVHTHNRTFSDNTDS